MRARLRFALDQTGGDADHALEGSSERDLGAEAEPVGELRHRGPRALQRIVATSAPAADVLPNRLSHQLGEPRGEGRAGHRNGFYDTANAMATTIATRALPAKVAVALAGVLTRSGAFLLYAFGGAQKLGQLGANRRKTRRGRARGCEGRVSTAPSRVSGALARGQARPGVRPVAGATTTRRRRSSSAGSSQGWRPSTRSWPRRWSTPRSDLARNSARRCCTSRARPITRSSTARRPSDAGGVARLIRAPTAPGARRPHRRKPRRSAAAIRTGNLVCAPAPRHDQAAATLEDVAGLAHRIYPLVVAFQALLVPTIKPWPLLVRSAVFPLVLLSLMTFLVMPTVTRVLQPWLGSR